MKGRKPTPTVLKIARGNPGKRPLNRKEPVTAALAPACPDELTGPVARAEWARGIVPAITSGQITAGDRCLAIAHCALWATWRDQVAEADGGAQVVLSGEHGYPKPNPVRLMANTTLMMLAKVDAELGFTPTSRSRVAAVKAEQTPDAVLEAFRREKE